MSVFHSIVDWAKTQKPIIKETFLRVVANNGYENGDIKKIILLLKKENNLESQSDSEINFLEFPQSLENSPPKSSTLILKRIQNTRNVATIKDQTESPFAHEGVTVIYGENGAGKSGIARILKQACRARKIDKVISNVFQSTQKTPTAELVVQIDGEEKNFLWTEGKHTIDELSNVWVFDSKCAVVQIDSIKNELFFVPQGGEIFRTMASCLISVKEELLKEKKQTTPPILSKHYPATTELSKLIADIGKIQSVYEFETKVTWTEEDKTELKKLQDLKTSTNEEANNKKQNQLILKQRKLSTLENFLVLANTIFSKERITSFNGLVKDLQTKKATLDVLSKSLKSNIAFQDVGGEVWRQLYLSAKNFSEQCYPGKHFPNLESEALCVLCQQPYSSESQTRMGAFEKLMESSIRKEYDTAKENLEKSIKYLQEHFIDNYETLNNILIDLKSDHDNLDNNELNVIKDCATKLVTLTAPLTVEEILTMSFNSQFLSKIQAICQDTIKLLEEVREILKPEKLSALNLNLQEYEYKMEVFDKKAEYLLFISDSLFNQKIDECIKQVDTTSITKGGNKIVSSYVCDLFLEKLKSELFQLGAKKIPLKLKTSGDSGVVNFDIGLTNAIIPESMKLTDILSEGEVKVISLAVFLGEVGIHPDKYPIVLDDPVTSLDHKYRENIAERLVLEGIERQVIIFTHDISFVTMIENNCLEKQVKLHMISMRNDNGQCEIKDESPWNAKKVEDRVTFLRNLQSKLKTDETSLDKETYNRRAGEIYGFLRETWERFVEETLFYKSISRFGYEVQTLRLKGVLITDEDYKAIYWGISKCSRWMIGHDDSAPLDSNRPDSDKILVDIEDFNTYFKSCKRRNNELCIQRQNLVNKTPDVSVG
jgi:energy-coupling factor transporter ATP-binding protein EcfA2